MGGRAKPGHDTSISGFTFAVLVLAAAVLTAAAAQRSAEYDEQYTMFLTAGVARPAWPDTPFAAGAVTAMQSGQASLAGIARDLRVTDVHPPLYFWSVALWRRMAGGGLFRARLFSVLCGVAALAAVGSIARSAGIAPALAMLLTLGCYGFVYTGAIARGFALAQALTLGGAALLLRRRRIAGSIALGAATATNYLAVFVAAVQFVWPGRGRTGVRSTKHTAAAVVSGALFRPLDLYFFLPQRGSRDGQFPPFHILPSLARLARYAAADIAGGLPLYVPAHLGVLAAAAIASFVLALAAVVVCRWRKFSTPFHRRLLAASAIAPPIGLLMLGIMFDSTPIELRYLAFAVPFAAMLLAGALASLPRPIRRPAIALVVTVQALAIAGLLTRPETMQPARAAAIAAAHLVQDGVVLVPRGNDGVGIVGAFASEAPPRLRLLVVAEHESPDRIRSRVGNANRVVLALLAQDASSRAAIPAMLGAFPTPCWRQAAMGFDVVAYDAVCGRGDNR